MTDRIAEIRAELERMECAGVGNCWLKDPCWGCTVTIEEARSNIAHLLAEVERLRAAERVADLALDMVDKEPWCLSDKPCNKCDRCEWRVTVAVYRLANADATEPTKTD